MKRTMSMTAVMVAVAGLLGACSDDGNGGSSATSVTLDPNDTAPPGIVQELADDATNAAVEAEMAAEPGGCDPLDTSSCLLPYPSNYYTQEDPVSPTHLRVNLPAAGMPTNASGVEVDPSEWNRNDGFSPNTPILVHLENLDPELSNLPSWTDIGASLEPTSPVVLVDMDTSEQIPLWAELDAHDEDPSQQLLVIHPAISLPEGHTFAVGLRGMLNHDRGLIDTGDIFRVYRDELRTTNEEVEYRRASIDSAISALVAAGVQRVELQLAWSFTVASTDNIAGRMLHIRDDALAQLGDASPAFHIDDLAKNAEDRIALTITGTYEVPNYLTGDGSPGQRFNYATDVSLDPDALPVQNGTIQVGFQCNVADATLATDQPAHLVQYGHGLLGGYDEINAGNVRDFANESNIVFCATKWAGMSEDDVANAIASLSDFSNFPTMADRLQQGVLNQIFLSRLMTRPDGLATVKALQRKDGTPLFDPTHLDYDGNSQGGIMGLMFAAVSPDIERAVLGVPGMNYSMLLPRSVDFDTYEQIFKPAYPNDRDRTVILGLTQMLWDRGEGAGYVQHVTSNPYPGTRAKQVLLDVAFGDHQVTPLSALVEARTMGLTIHRPVAATGRWAEAEPGWGLETTTYPSSGSAIIIWDSGMAPMPIENLAPREGDDSHEDPRADADVRRQKAAFLFDDTLIDVCNAAACTADHRA